MATLAVVDNLPIIVKMFLMLFSQHKVAIGRIGCKTMYFLGNHLVLYANWVLVAMAVERFFAVWQPLKVSQMWTSRKAAVSLAVLLLVTVAMTTPLFVTVTAEDKWGFHTCAIDRDYSSFMSVWQMSQVIAYGFLPCFLLLTTNALIIIVISRARRLHRSMTSSVNHSGAASKHHKSSAGSIQRQATIMLVVTSTVFVLTMMPICVYMLVHNTWTPQKGTVEFAKKELLRFMLRVICDANHSVNFYLYFVSASKFRSYFCKVTCLLCSRYMKRRGSEVTTRHSRFSGRSTLKVKGTGSEGHTLVFERKAVEEDDCTDNRLQLKLYSEKGENGSGASLCGSLL